MIASITYMILEERRSAMELFCSVKWLWQHAGASRTGPCPRRSTGTLPSPDIDPDRRLCEAQEREEIHFHYWLS